MDAYIYQAALICKDCAKSVMDANKGDLNCDQNDSDDFPQGPYPNGGGESDSPEHCDFGANCVHAEPCGEHNGQHKIGVFLENPLTEEGYKYMYRSARMVPPGCVARSVWLPFYGKPHV